MDNDLRAAILDAKYIDLIDLAGSLIAEFGEDPAQAAELAGPQQQALAAAVFRWAASDIDETIAVAMGRGPGRALAEARQARADMSAPADAPFQPMSDPAPTGGDTAMADPGQPSYEPQMQTNSFGAGPLGPDGPTS
ncbi:hypothetical protein [Histidinibacterium lentulum]|uniref:Uncharacterized protein n=1 Tax=Histidinibacterium lentulum TaxID=2480588 RepID=A0A3N2QTH3_9RHOB|nr:hypothetical protein [Histidinibacterium lentulum]ROT98508.1 hypothetical protein EAT49_16330 [Histidinibacterium lentulum]